MAAPTLPDIFTYDWKAVLQDWLAGGISVQPRPSSPVTVKPPGAPVEGGAPASRIPAANRGEKAAAAAPTGDCARSLSWTTPAGWAAAALGREAPEGAVHHLCWSDVWFYGAAVGVIIGGAWLAFKGAGK